ncbi:MAG: hypothetical protein CL902_11240 [Dehalococcoidia bacterium]|nr:hypothetical protein [Dehalococcoidia bacterium]|tara:strand:- start:32 stop:622 length:591 start_codon:yes stop_codon:yes gene_type:complete
MRVVILLLAILALSAFIGCQAKPMVVSESGSESEGIKVHGDWTVEVTNPDGSLAKKIEFSNFITEDGREVLARLLTHGHSVADRRLLFMLLPSESNGGNSSGINCNDAGEETMFPRAPKASAVISADHKSSIWTAGCTVSIKNDLKSAWLHTVFGKLVLEDDKNIWRTFSQKSLSTPVEVVDGQTISATVVYAFQP